MEKEESSGHPAWVFAVIPMLIPLTLWRAWVLTVLWGWFMSSTGFVVDLRIAIGALLVVAIVNHRNHERDKKEHVALSILFGFFLPALALGVGYVLHLVTGG